MVSSSSSQLKTKVGCTGCMSSTWGTTSLGASATTVVCWLRRRAWRGVRGGLSGRGVATHRTAAVPIPFAVALRFVVFRTVQIDDPAPLVAAVRNLRAPLTVPAKLLPVAFAGRRWVWRLRQVSLDVPVAIAVRIRRTRPFATCEPVPLAAAVLRRRTLEIATWLPVPEAVAVRDTVVTPPTWLYWMPDWLY